ncbi:MAG TPA: tRNA lysidine(34) synthetase TilS [Saprospiraceae bacterium]|nr:tRNA lysidine(34) synthetase TilS [Saprospiraceae bacterium]
MRPVYRRFRQKLDLLTEEATQPSFLLAVSGGLDSMVLWDLLSQSNLVYGVAHCNFQLRGNDSDADEAFVSDQAAKQSIPFLSTRFDTLAFAKKEQLSTQEAARNLRYEWLEKQRQENGYSYIVTAHHLDDSIETFLYNFTKGTGLKGLLGIPEKNDKIIRPLLSFSRETLKIYYQSRQLRHREDASNASDQYQRNKLRHHVLPVLYEINPGLAERFLRNTSILQDTYYLFQEQVAAWKQKVWKEENNQVHIDLSRLSDHPALATLLFEWLQAFQFHPDQARQMVDSFRRNQSGARFLSASHELLVDRSSLLLKKRVKKVQEKYTINEGTQQVLLPNGRLTITHYDGQPGTFPKDHHRALFDAATLKFPLRLRHWEAGDTFSPLGMSGKHKKIQDLFSDRKINRFEKQNIWLLTDVQDRICWVVGLQMDERFKITPATKTYYHFHFQEDTKQTL